MDWIRVLGVGWCLALAVVCPAPAIAVQDCAPALIQGLETPTGLGSDGFGARVAMSDRFLAVLTPLTLPDGLVVVYRRSDDSSLPWTLDQQIAIDSSFPGMLQGASLAIEGNTLAVGVSQDDRVGPGAGAVYLYERSGAGQVPWQHAQTLHAPDGKPGDAFGFGLAICGHQLVVGAPMESSIGTWNGAAYYFEREGNAPNEWVFHQKLVPRSLEASAGFGGVIDLDDNTLAVGAPLSSWAVLQGGAVYLFSTQGATWAESQVLTAPDAEFHDGFGGGLALSGDWLIVSSPLDDDLGVEAGAAHVFRRTGDRWSYHQKVLPETGDESDTFGNHVAADGSTFCVGVPTVNEFGISSGTVYGFGFDEIADAWIQTFRFFPPDLDANDNLSRVAVRNGLVAAGAPKSGELGAVYFFSARAGRDVASYCTPTSGSLPDCAPALETLGAPSASQGSTFRIWSRHVPGAKSGVMLYAPGGPARADLAASGVCIPGSGLRRKGLFWSGGTFGACDGSFHLDWNDFIDDRDPADSLLTTPGATVHVQVAWFDALVPGAPAWSDALAFQLCP